MVTIHNYYYYELALHLWGMERSSHTRAMNLESLFHKNLFYFDAINKRNEWRTRPDYLQLHFTSEISFLIPDVVSRPFRVWYPITVPSFYFFESIKWRKWKWQEQRLAQTEAAQVHTVPPSVLRCADLWPEPTAALPRYWNIRQTS